jgi:hypothetical protein
MISPAFVALAVNPESEKGGRDSLFCIEEYVQPGVQEDLMIA